MAAVDSDESDFGDDMALVPSMKAHTGSQGLGAASAPAAAVPLKKVALHRPHMADVLLAERMRIVQQYDLTTAVGMDARGACTWGNRNRCGPTMHKDGRAAAQYACAPPAKHRPYVAGAEQPF